MSNSRHGRSCVLFLAAVTGLLSLAFVPQAVAQVAERPVGSAAELMPASSIAFVELAEPGRFVKTVLEHPVRPKLEQLDAWKKATQDRKYLEFQFGLKFLELALGMSWQEAIDVLAGEGICASFDATTQGVAVVSRSRDPARLLAVRDKLMALAREDAKRKGQPDPYQTHEYRGVTAYGVQGNAFALLGPWLMIVNKGDLGKAIIDRYLDGGGQPETPTAALAFQPRFAAARAGIAKTPTVWLFGDVEALRTAGAAREIFAGKTDNPLGELLIGGLLDILKQAPYTTASFDLTASGVNLDLAMPYDPGWVNGAREYYFGPGGAGVAASMPEVPETLLSLTLYRDMGKMWRRADELLQDNAAQQLAQANGQLSTLFSGKDFGEEILGVLSPRVRFVATRSSADPAYPRPAIRLPAFALLLEMNEPEMTRREMRRIFQSLIGFLNITGAMNGQPQLELDVEKSDGAELVTSLYIPEAGRDTDGQAKINFNFSPSAGFAGNRFVIASTRGLARQLASGAAGAHNDDTSPPRNTAARLDAGVLRAILDDNREQLVSQNMLSEGRTREEAERQIDLLLSVVGMLRDAGLTLSSADGRLHLELSVAVRAD